LDNETQYKELKEFIDQCFLSFIKSLNS
jgi:hypothetical protein